MDSAILKKRLKPQATCEGALYRQCSVSDKLDMSKEEIKVLNTAKQNGGKNQTFKALKELTELTESGMYAPLNIAKAVHENLPELYKLARKKRIIIKAAKRRGEISGKARKLQIEKDLTIPDRHFTNALDYLYLVRHGLMTAKQKRILHDEEKGATKELF